MFPETTDEAPAAAEPASCDAAVPPTDAPLQIDDVIDLHHKLVFGYALRLVGNSSDAEDLTQQTFLIAHQRLHQLRSNDRVMGWLFAILRNCFLKMGRRKRPMCESSMQLDLGQLSEVDWEPAPIETTDLQSALDQLSDEHRMILTMYYFEHLSYRRIAEQLDVKIGTVMSRLSRAKSKLRGILLERGWKHD